MPIIPDPIPPFKGPGTLAEVVQCLLDHLPREVEVTPAVAAALEAGRILLKTPPSVVVEIRQGLVDDVWANVPVSVLVLDFDTEHAVEIDELAQIPSLDGQEDQTPERAYSREHEATVDPMRVAVVYDAHKEAHA